MRLKLNLNNFGKSKNDEQENPDIRLARTWTNTSFEIIIGLLLLILWGGIFFKLATAGDTLFPIHYDLNGKADSYASPYWLLLVGGFCTGLSVYYMFSAYRPTNMLDAGTRITNMRQVKVLVYWAYIFSIELIITGCGLVFTIPETSSLFMKIMAAVMIITCLGTTIATRMLR